VDCEQELRSRANRGRTPVETKPEAEQVETPKPKIETVWSQRTRCRVCGQTGVRLHRGTRAGSNGVWVHNSTPDAKPCFNSVTLHRDIKEDPAYTEGQDETIAVD
jgi:hypothetical protein